MARSNPQGIITPDAFAVSPDLLGIGLASPSRRLIAIAVDGVLLAILAHLGGKLLFTLATAVVLWRSAALVTGRSPGKVKTVLRIASVVLLTIFLSLIYGRVMGMFSGIDRAESASDDVRDGAPAASAGSGADTTGAAGGGGGAPDTAQQPVIDENGNINLKGLGLSFRDVRVMSLISDIQEAEDSADAAEPAAALREWIEGKPDAARPQLARAFTGVVQDAPGHAAVAAEFAQWLPVDTIAPGDTVGQRLAALSNQADSLERENRDLRKKVEDAEEGFSIRRLLRSLSDVAGFGLGWSALYFTGFMMMMRGQTPGKKLFGIRVIRLDGRPVSPWIAFERFGGYAASAATGLLGFAQILWDRNRQALHDKATETVVIREVNGKPVRPAAPYA